MASGHGRSSRSLPILASSARAVPFLVSSTRLDTNAITEKFSHLWWKTKGSRKLIVRDKKKTGFS